MKCRRKGATMNLKLTRLQRVMIYICICLSLVYGCQKQVHACVDSIYTRFDLHSEIRLSKMQTNLPNQLDESSWALNEDVVYHTTSLARRIHIAYKGIYDYDLSVCIMAALASMLAYLFVIIHYGNSYPTEILSCILAYMWDTDGKKKVLS